ncbi:elongator complex protein 6 [Phtheirospermum japonicum]|uniref:Elongator complex protein 6 n=1 Tax=Phtheirospermum japonicum TaxID=374723 RepID=A0A830BQD7_9LAMI|nr:elongator complex protein 6 [Phtheirospermum japonicum]
MANASPSNLLDESLNGKDAIGYSSGGGRMILVEDCVETSGAFVVHQLLKRALSPHSSDVVVFLSFAHPFSHYDRILRKMGCNLSVQRDSKRLLFFDMLMAERLDSDRRKTSEDKLISLYGEVQKAVELCLSDEGRRHVTLIIDDVSLMEIDANGSSNVVLDFLHYCDSLTAQFGCSLIALNHDDVYSTTDGLNLLLQLEYLADVVMKVEPLATGLATDVHGQLTVTNKELGDGPSKLRNKVHNFQFRIKDSGVEYFYPGSKA